MKIIKFLLLAIFLNSCTKHDTINHYLNEKVTESELIENGFFKYSFTYTYENDEDEKDSLNGKVFKNVLYSNVKPQRQDDGKLYPFPLFGYRKLDKEKEEEKYNYIINELHYRIITYRFVNDELTFKSIFVHRVNENIKQSADFTSEKKIIEYYKSQKVPFKQRLGGKKYGKDKLEFPYRFRINNYESGIYILRDDQYPGYQMVTTYENVKENEEPIYDFFPTNPDQVVGWYSGSTYEYEE